MSVLIVILFIAFFTDVVQIFAIGSYGVTLIDFVMIAIFIVFIKKIVWDGFKLEFSFHYGYIFLVAMIFAAILSGLTPLIKGSTPQMVQYLKTSAHLIFLISFTLFCAMFKIETKAWTNFIRAWLILSILINLFGIYQIFARTYDLPLAWLQFTNVSLTGRSSDDIDAVHQLSLRYGNFFRATSIFTEPSAFASFNILIQIFILVPFVQKMKPFFNSKTLMITIFTISIISLFLCFSMTGFVGIAMVLGCIFIFHRSKRLIPFIAGFFATIIIIIATDSLIESFSGASVVNLFSKRLSGILFSTQGTEGESVGVRLRSAKVGIEVWEDHFLLGTGLGLTSYNNNKGVEFGDFASVASLTEMGILGFISFTGMFAALFFICFKLMIRIKARDNLPDELKRLSGILFYIMMHQFLINFISGNNMVRFVLWMFLGFVFAVINEISRIEGKKAFSITVVKKPLKISLNESILHYIKINFKQGKV